MDDAPPGDSILSHVPVVQSKKQASGQVCNGLVESLPGRMWVGGRCLELDLPVVLQDERPIRVGCITDACVWSHKFCSSYFIRIHTGLHSVCLSSGPDVDCYTPVFLGYVLLLARICNERVLDHDDSVHPQYKS